MWKAAASIVICWFDFIMFHTVRNWISDAGSWRKCCIVIVETIPMFIIRWREKQGTVEDYLTIKGNTGIYHDMAVLWESMQSISFWGTGPLGMFWSALCPLIAAREGSGSRSSWGKIQDGDGFCPSLYFWVHLFPLQPLIIQFYLPSVITQYRCISLSY